MENFKETGLTWEGMKALEDIVIDNSTTEITVETPEGWKCERKNCYADYLHSHGTYSSLTKPE